MITAKEARELANMDNQLSFIYSEIRRNPKVGMLCVDSLTKYEFNELSMKGYIIRPYFNSIKRGFAINW